MYHRKDITFSKPSIFQAGIEEYATRVSTAPPDESAKVATETAEKCPQWADIASSSLQASFISMIAGMTHARRALEVGTFTGHATLAIAAALPDDGTITTIDSFVADETAREIATSAFEASDHSRKISLLEMDALSALDRVGRGYDLIFIDADKPNYKNYFEKIIGEGILAPDGVLLVDNTLWGGRVLRAADGSHDLGTSVDADEWVDNLLSEWAKYVIEFNDHVNNDPRVENVMLTVHDGMTIIRYADSN
jgi:caffeoyl-CoA O-methyltransferase